MTHGWTRNQLLILALACAAVFATVCAFGMRANSSMTQPMVAQASPLPSRTSTVLAVPAQVPSFKYRADSASDLAQPQPDSPAAVEYPQPEEGDALPEDLRRMVANPTTDTIPQLVDVARNPGDARHRLLAVSGLRRAGMGGSAEAADALREFASSDDQVISGMALAAVRQLDRRRATH